MEIGNKVLFIFAAIFLFGILASVQVSSQPLNVTNYSVSPTAGGVQVSVIKYTPYPANPGDYIDLWVQASLGNSVNYANFTVLQNFPFSVDPGESASQVFTNMASRDVVMHFKVRVSSNAVPGMNDLKLGIITNPASNAVNVDDINVYVQNAQTNFATVVQDESSSQVSLAIANIGENTANSMIVKIPDQPDFRVSGTNGQMVGNLNAGDYSIVNFDILPVMMRGGYNSGNNLTVEIDYTDNIGVRRSVLENVTFNPSYSANATNFAAASGGSGTTTFTRGNFSRSSGGLSWWIWLIIVVVVVAILFFVIKKNPEFFRKIFSQNKPKKPQKGNSELPDWIRKEKSKK